MFKATTKIEITCEQNGKLDRYYTVKIRSLPEGGGESLESIITSKLPSRELVAAPFVNIGHAIADMILNWEGQQRAAQNRAKSEFQKKN